MANQSLFIFGLGYSTTGIARQAQHRQIGVTSTCRKPDRFAPLGERLHGLVKFDPAAKQLLSDDGLQALHDASYVVSSIPPIAAKLYDPVLQAQLKSLQHVASSRDCRISGLGYLSSTGVYGDWQGEWVDERSKPCSASGRGILRLEAEAAWAALANQLRLPLTILRLGGIYGPRRSVLHNLQTQANPSSSAARRSRQRYTSRCHVADAAQAVLADMQRRTTKGQQQRQQQHSCDAVFTWPGLNATNTLVDVINVVDDEPAPRCDVEQYALHLLGTAATLSMAEKATPPTVIDASTSNCGMSDQPDGQQEPGQQPCGSSDAAAAQQHNSSGASSSRRGEQLEEKRVRNDKLKLALGVQLLAPTYREGLHMMHAGDTAPFTAVDLSCLFS